MDEFARIATYFAPLAAAAGRGLADDAAVLTPPVGRELVLTTDQMLEGIHFLPGDDPALIARKLLRRNLSDLAAMGATPLGYLLTMALPVAVPETWLASFTEGLARDQQFYNIGLLGGDSSSARTEIALSATLLGHCAPGQALARKGAKPGDKIFVTGTIGDAVLGLQARLGKLSDPSGFLTQRSLLPDPRVGLALAGIASAAIDISDGLVQDLGHICHQSGVRAVVNTSAVPLSPQAEAVGPTYLPLRLTGGDDYELLLAVPPAREAALRLACGDVKVTQIGQFEAGQGVQLLDGEGHALNLTETGWRHF